MRVFLSSTVHDLLDIRAEIAELLRSLDISPVLSDDKLSDFAIQFDANSIETCLINVASCDEVILVLDRRYGPSLAKAGYPDISATHLEYQHAVKHKKPLHFYVRDRLEADYSIWRKNRRNPDIDLSWIDSKNHGLFTFLDEHRKLKAGSTSSNWFTTFTTSADLKASLRKHFEKAIRPETLVKAIYENRFPLFNVNLDTAYNTIDNVGSLKLTAEVTNVGGAAAFNFHMYWEGEKRKDSLKAIMAPGQSTTMVLIYGLHRNAPGVTRCLVLEYETPIGIAVTDRFDIRASVRWGPQPLIRSGALLLKRQFRRAKKIAVEIDET